MFNVLIVDDDPMVAELNRLFISRVADFHCCGVAATIGGAKAMLSHLAQVDLLLLDVYMQQENGLDLLPSLRADARNIDVIMMTSAADALTLQTALHYGVVDYLIKPFQFPRFEEALQTWRNKREVKQAKSCYAQADIDTLLRRGIPQQESARRLPKGLTPQTLRLVCQWIDAHQARDFSTNELAAALQISRVSCRKYLIWLEQINVLFTTNHYGITGRPEYRYRLVVENVMLLTQYSQ
ncbi:Transcriptional regulatory protein DcuR [Klebsiella variicola]|uniref:two-component system response regulator DcuR n=1 Tax=Klebsiella TaxID=570 RepID=UPI000C28E2E7|nr:MULTISPECIES: two-component system response regulator DcuR [Klebsiella]PJR56660.1 two-component system response regulator DcuR [Klebsiella sp. I-Nf8]PJR67405.1 two-component system response regulator DcuR [Klebsiella sp. K-Nf6]PJX70460.1 two-component system response regulator DcuR [Klebsiella sp. G-Nf4]PJX74016.1 two-component system response regulator DcuR [Klebsiella sp. G2-16S-Nf13]PKJ77609.1 two-component system response regulator DcuR [Klebsiella sp. J-Nf11]